MQQNPINCNKTCNAATKRAVYIPDNNSYCKHSGFSLLRKFPYITPLLLPFIILYVTNTIYMIVQGYTYNDYTTKFVL